MGLAKKFVQVFLQGISEKHELLGQLNIFIISLNITPKSKALVISEHSLVFSMCHVAGN